MAQSTYTKDKQVTLQTCTSKKCKQNTRSKPYDAVFNPKASRDCDLFQADSMRITRIHGSELGAYNIRHKETHTQVAPMVPTLDSKTQEEVLSTIGVESVSDDEQQDYVHVSQLSSIGDMIEQDGSCNMHDAGMQHVASTPLNSSRSQLSLFNLSHENNPYTSLMHVLHNSRDASTNYMELPNIPVVAQGTTSALTESLIITEDISRCQRSVSTQTCIFLHPDQRLIKQTRYIAHRLDAQQLQSAIQYHMVSLLVYRQTEHEQQRVSKAMKHFMQIVEHELDDIDKIAIQKSTTKKQYYHTFCNIL